MGKYAYSFNPIKELDLDIPRSSRREALEAGAEYLRDAVLRKIAKGRSPVANGKWTRTLTKGYSKRKGEESSAKFANLELSGELLDSLDVSVDGSKLVYGVPSDQAGKAEGNNIGTYGRSKSTGRVRRFIPIGDEKFSKDILSGLRDVLADFEE